MHAVGSQPQHDVARPNIAAVNHAVFFHHAHGKARQIVFAVGIHTGHFSRFAANQGATGFFAAGRNAFDHIGGTRHIQFAARKIIQEKQRLCALHQNIVHAHGY